MTSIPATPADGNVQVMVMPTVADMSAPTVTEWTAGVDISCYLTGDGLAPSLSEQAIADERLCETQTYEQKGTSQRGLEVTYIDNDNATDVAALNVAKETLIPGSKHVIGIRRGLPYETAAAAAQKVTLYPITAGEWNELPPERNSVLKVTQKEFVTGAAQFSVALAV